MTILDPCKQTHMQANICTIQGSPYYHPSTSAGQRHSPRQHSAAIFFRVGDECADRIERWIKNETESSRRCARCLLGANAGRGYLLLLLALVFDGKNGSPLLGDPLGTALAQGLVAKTASLHLVRQVLRPELLSLSPVSYTHLTLPTNREV